ncbi:hypothetical protein WJX82_003523 [Trebouxia sp. C0006]
MLNVKQVTSSRGVGAGVNAVFKQGWETLPLHPRSVRCHPERRSARHRCITLQVSARNRILFEASELQHDGRLNLALQDDRSTHLIQVLKLQPQDQVKVGIVNGPFGQATVLHTQPEIVLQCQHWQNPPKLDQLYLVLAMPRPKVMKRLWSTLACLGVMRVYITGAEKVEKVYFASHALKPERFYPELIHGAEQAGDTRLPAVFFSKSLHASLAAVQTAVEYTNPSQQAPKPAAKAATSAPDSNVPTEAIKLLAHTVGGLSVHQAVASHMAGHSNSSVQAAKHLSSDEAYWASTGLGDQIGSDSQHSCDRLTAAGGELRVGGQWQDNLIGQSIADNERQHSAIGRPITGSGTQDRPVVVLAIGPEGGWVDSEIALLTDQYGFQVVTTASNRTLDTTTAVISLESGCSVIGRTTLPFGKAQGS